MKIGEFFVQLGVDAETTKVKDFVKAISNLSLETVGALGALGAISFKLQEIAQHSVESAVGFQAFTAQTGLSAQELQRWQNVAAQANVSVEAMTQSVSGLQRQLAEIRLGRGNIAPFQMLGIGANQDAFAVMQQLRGKVRGMDRATATNLISQMGLAPEMMNVLTMSEQRFRQYTNLVHGMTNEQAEGFLKAKLAAVQFGLVVRDLGMNLLYNLGSAAASIVSRVLDMRNGLLYITAAAAALTVALSPLTAAVALLLLVLEDLAVYFKGGESLTGEAVEGLKTLFDAPLESAKALLEVLGQLGNKLTGGFIGRIAGLMAPAVSGFGNGGAPSTVNNHTKVDVHVSGSGDPHETAKAVKRELERSVNAATLQTNNGGH